MVSNGSGGKEQRSDRSRGSRVETRGQIAPIAPGKVTSTSRLGSSGSGNTAPAPAERACPCALRALRHGFLHAQTERMTHGWTLRIVERSRWSRRTMLPRKRADHAMEKIL
jgi:hypothetical protein